VGILVHVVEEIISIQVRRRRLAGAGAGLEFYLKPDFAKVKQAGLGEAVFAALGQSFFTLSIGIGALSVFGSRIDKSHSLTSDAIYMGVLDTVVALIAGLIIFPACFSFGVNPDSGPNLLFITLPNIFNVMSGGRFWGSLFFLFMSFAALSTVIAVFENIMSFSLELFHVSRKKAAIVNILLVSLLSMPCVLGFNVWSGFAPLGPGSTVQDLEDFIVSSVILPLGSLVYLMFCVSGFGWGFRSYLEEANTGKGMRIPKWLGGYLKYVLPVMILFLFLEGIIGKFFG